MGKKLEIPLSLDGESQNSNVLMYRTTYTQNGVSVRYEVTGVPKNGSFDTYLVLQLSGSRESLLYIEQIQETFAKALKMPTLFRKLALVFADCTMLR